MKLYTTKPYIHILISCAIITVVLVSTQLSEIPIQDSELDKVSESLEIPELSEVPDPSQETSYEEIRDFALERAKKYVDQSNYLLAIDILKEALGELPNDPVIKSTLRTYTKEYDDTVRNTALATSKEYASIGDYASAIKAIQQAIDILENDAELSLLYAEYAENYKNSILVETEELASNGGFEDATATLNSAITLLGNDDELLSLYHLINIPDWYKFEEVVVKGNQICFSREVAVIWDTTTSSSVDVFTFDEDENLIDVRSYEILDSSILAERYCNELNTYERNGKNSFGYSVGEAKYYCYGKMIVEIFSKSYIKQHYPLTLSGVVSYYRNIELSGGAHWPVTYLD